MKIVSMFVILVESSFPEMVQMLQTDGREGEPCHK